MKIKEYSLAGALTKYASYVVLGVATIGCDATTGNDTPKQENNKTSIEQKLGTKEEIPRSNILEENSQTPTEWKVNFSENKTEKYCSGHERKIYKVSSIFGHKPKKLEFCGGCQPKQVNYVKEKTYTANNLQELTKKVSDELSNQGLQEMSFEGRALITKNENEPNDKTARVNLASIVDNIENTNYTSSSKAVIVETHKGAGIYVVSKIKNGKEEESKKTKEINDVDLPSGGCLEDLAKSIACEANLAILETIISYGKGEEKISINPLFDFGKAVGKNTIKNLTDRYTPETIKALKDILEYAQTAEEIIDLIGDNLDVLDLHIVLQKLGLEKMIDYLGGKIVLPLDEKCEDLAQKVKEKCSRNFKSYSERKEARIKSALERVNTEGGLEKIPVKIEQMHGHNLRYLESVADWFRSRGLSGDFGTRKGTFELSHPGETYTGSKEQNEKWLKELNKPGDGSIKINSEPTSRSPEKDIFTPAIPKPKGEIVDGQEVPIYKIEPSKPEKQTKEPKQKESSGIGGKPNKYK